MSYVIFGKASASAFTNSTLPPASAAEGFTLNGIASSDASGRSLTGLGDVNDDGIDDFLVTAPSADPNGGGSGEAYVVFGGQAFGTSVELSDVGSTVNGFRVDGLSGSDGLGFREVRQAGDINGDGVADIIVGARFGDNSAINAGESYVIFGGASVGSAGAVDLSRLSGSDGFVINGDSANDRSGTSVSGAGDFNGDGFDDLIIGAPGYGSEGSINPGEAFVLFGGATFGASIDLSSLTVSDGIKFQGPAGTYATVGYSVSAAGDVDGDGFDDVIIGAPYQYSDPGTGGKSYLIFGGEFGGTVTDLGTTGADTLTGTAAAQVMIGGQGDDTLIGNGGADSLRGGLGDDILAISDLAFQRVDGGAGTDTLRLDGTGLALDLTAIGNEALQDIEVVDLTGSGDNSLTVNANEVFNLSGNANTLRVTGDSGDALNLVGSWTNTGTTDIGGVTHDVYSTGNATIQVEQDVTTSVAALPSFSIDDAFVNESSGSATFTVTRSGNTALLSSVDFATADSTATAGSDYAAATGTLSFTAGETTKTISVSVTPDSNVEADEFYFVNLSNASEATIADSQGLGTITTAPELTIGDVTVAENAGTVTFTVTRTGDTTGESSAAFTTANNTATAGSDFTATSGTVSFAVGQTTASIAVTITNDSIFGNTETFFVNLSSPVAATLGDSQGQGTITDSDAGILLSGLDGTTGFRIDGPDANDRAGGSVSSAGDVNGDGFEDLIIGAIYGGSAGAEAGEAYVVFGAASFGTNLSLPTSGTNGFRLDGIDAGDRNGYSVSGAGDVNGDGFADLIIGATRGTPNGSSSGESYVVFGGSNVGSSTSVDLSALDGSDGFRIDGLFASLSAYSVSGAGDVNGDGFADVIVGAARADANGNSSGESYVVFGKASGFAANIALSSLDGTTGFRIQGIEALDYSGRVVSGAGDVNGDGIDDLIISSPEENLGSDPGEAYVVFGNASGFDATLDLGDLDGTNGFQLNGIDNSDRTGFSISAAGDVNGDGIGDLIIGAPFADPNGLSSGESYVVFGTSSGFAATLALSSLGGTTGFRIDGVSSGDSSGRSVSGAGDVNGDGFDDLLIGAYGSDVTASGAGVTYLVFGKASGFGTSLALSSLDGTSGLRFDGISQNDNSGKSVSGAGDVNGDGFDDLIIGAALGDAQADKAGESYVVFGGVFAGSVSFLGTTSAETLTGTSAAETFVAGLGNDIVVGGGGADVLRGGQGDDQLTVSDTTFFRVDGGGGTDTLAFDGSGLSLDLTSVGSNKIQQIETIDITGSGNNTLSIDPAGLSSMLEGTNRLIVEGNAGDTVVLQGNYVTGTEVVGSETYDTYGQGGARLLVDQSLTVTGVPTELSIFDQTVTVAEAGGSVTFKLVRSGDLSSASSVSVDTSSGTATAGFDFTAVSTTVNFAIGETTKTVTVSIAGDAAVELNETFTVTLSNPTNVTIVNSTATVTITDDDLSLALSSLDGSDGFRLDGAAGDKYSGYSVSAIGDVNGDGFEDVIIGVDIRPFFSSSGGAYVVFGGPSFGASLDLSTLDGTTGFRINKVGDYDGVAQSVGGAGDVNGDGLADIVIGSPDAYPAGSSSGATYVVFGAATFSSTLDLSTLDGTNGFILNGVTSFDDSGQSVGIGDVNGDGYDDVIVGAPDGDATASNAGETYVVFGKASSFAATIELSSLNGSTGFRIDGVSDSDDSGYGVSAAGDINGDGIDDLIIGAPRGDAIASNAGETYVVFGKTSGFGSTLALSSLDGTTGFRVDGIGISDLSGITVSAGGGINGDGIGDLIIGAPYADTNDVNSGATYVVFGGSAVGSGGSLQLSALNGSDGFVLNGTDNIDNAGRAVSSAGDLNGDGYDDLLIGAPYGDGAATNGGEAYVVFGKASGFTASLELSALDGTDGFRLDGVSGSDLAGRAASVAGDVNGDGFDDLIIGALYGDAGGSNSGESYVVFGGVFGGSVDFLGTTGADTLSAGTSAAETFVAGRGNDTLTGGGGADVLRGGEGDDILGVSDATFLRIDGGTDASGGVGDTLRFDGTNLAIDLTAIKDLKVQNIERIDMTGAGTNSLTLSLSDVLNISETSNTLTLLGGTGESDAVTVSDGEWTNDGSVDGFTTYTLGAASLVIDDDISALINLAPA